MGEKKMSFFNGRVQFKSVGMSAWVLGSWFGLCLLGSSLSFGAYPQLAEILRSRAGQLIFGELIEGSVLANRLLGTNVPNAALRSERLVSRLASTEMQEVATELQARLERVMLRYSEELAAGATTGARGHAGAEEGLALFRTAGPRESITDSERRILMRLVRAELRTDGFEALERATAESMRARATAAAARQRGRTLLPQENAFLFWETQKNGAAQRSHEVVAIENYEIPLELLHQDVAARMPAELRSSLIFERDRKQFVRWIINPEDTEHYKAVETFLRSKGVEPVRHQTFSAYQTASRSYIIVDESSGGRVVFSAKVSTNHTGGHWRDKKQPVEDAAEARRAADFVYEQNRVRPFDHIILQDEPAMFGIAEIDQAMLIRTLGELSGREITYLPGFSAVHEDLGRRIAAANGSNNPAVFWDQHYNKPLARAIAELAARTGLTYDSPHSQNFLIEMVGVNPTGRIVMRDFGDTYAMKDFFKAMGMDEFLRGWEGHNIIRGRLHVGVGVLHGNEMPSWISNSVYNRWGQSFYQTFEAEFSALTRIPVSSLNSGSPFSRSGRYFSRDYSTSQAGWREYFERLRTVR
jgi:hypothetical protein